jgi:hypothetical protein
MKTEKISLTKLFKIGILFFGISLLLWNCEKDEVLIENTVSINLEKVKSIYKAELNQKEFSNLKKEPLWNEAKILYNNDKEYIEIPFRIVKQKELDKSTSMSNDRLLAFISPDNKLTVNIVHYFAQDIKKSIPDFQNLSYFNIGNFNGFVTLYDLDKNLISLDKFNNGIKSSKKYIIYEKKKNDDNIFYRMPTDCEMHTETIVTESCWFWYYENTGRTEIINCTYDYNTISYQTCDTNGEGGGGSSSETKIVEEEIISIDNQLEGKAKCIYEKMVDNKGNINWILENFNDNNGPSQFNLKLQMSDSLGNLTNGSTSTPLQNGSNNTFIISINSNRSENINTALTNARTLIHESIHARLWEFMYSRDKNLAIVRNDFPGIYDYYMNHQQNWDHEQMAAHYRQTIANGLKQFDNGQHTDSYYNALAWEGLSQFKDANNNHELIYSQAWQKLSSNEQQQVLQIISYEKTNGSKECN